MHVQRSLIILKSFEFNISKAFALAIFVSWNEDISYLHILEKCFNIFFLGLIWKVLQEDYLGEFLIFLTTAIAMLNNHLFEVDLQILVRNTFKSSLLVFFIVKLNIGIVLFFVQLHSNVDYMI